jgi:DNA transformation protein
MADGRQGHLRYYTVPAEALESVAEMQPWAREAMASALRAKASKAPAKPRTRAARSAKPAAKKRLAKL